VRTLLQCLVAIIHLRTHPQALWLSELGSYLDGYDGPASSGAAGTRRVGKLLRSVKWTVELINRYLLEKADEEVQKLKEQEKRILSSWDGFLFGQTNLNSPLTCHGELKGGPVSVRQKSPGAVFR